MSENIYRDYLSDDKLFYRQYLKNEEEPVGSSFLTKFIMGTTAAVGLVAGSRALYRKGMMRAPYEKMIDTLGQYRTPKIQDNLDAIRKWTQEEAWDDAKEMSKLQRMWSHSDQWREVGDRIRVSNMEHERRMAKLAESPIIQDKNFELTDMIDQKEIIKKRQGTELDKSGDVTKQKRLRAWEKYMDDTILKLTKRTKDQQAAMAKRTGYQEATVADVWEHLPEETRALLQKTENNLKSRNKDFTIMDSVIDRNILVSKDSKGNINKFADLRDWRETIEKIGDSVTEDFTIPFININPLRMYYLNHFTKRNQDQTFAVLKGSNSQILLNGNNMPLGDDLLFVKGYAHRYNPNTEQLEVVNERRPGILVNAGQDGSGTGSLLARGVRNMFNMYNVEFTRPEGKVRGLYYDFMKKLDLGFQNEHLSGHSTADEIGNPFTPLNKAAGWMHQKVWKPYDEVIEKSPPFGHGADHVFIPRYRSFGESKGVRDYFKQFYAGRGNYEDVTTTSFIGYTFAERLNATIGQMQLGLSAERLGSAPQILGNLIGRRLLPIWGTIEGVKLTNYAWEQVTGDEYEDQLADFFATSQVNVAKARDALGVTDWAKTMTEVMPGFEFLAELPIPFLTTEGMTPIMLKDLMPLNQSEEELREYYESGVEPIRKGRYWETGHTPLTGGKVDYYVPNWFRRITSDYEYTDTLWGSKEEYWQNHAITNPLQHFILDPYHWEKKWYEDRPYPQTGGIAEIESIPLVGGFLNATVGQIFKPTIRMHEEEFANPEGYNKEKLGFQLAEQLGVIEEKIGAPQDEGGIMGVQTGSVGAQLSGNLGVAGNMSGYSTQGTYSGDFAPGEPMAYVTSSGNVQVMRATQDVNMYQLNEFLQSSGIAKSGTVETIWLGEPIEAGPEEDPVNPASMETLMADYMYNMTEMGGWYGWNLNVLTENILGLDPYEERTPKLATSEQAYGYTRAFWDMELGNMGGDAMEIYRRFVPRDMSKNYVNPLDNRMPTWAPGEDYFTNFQEGDPYTKVKRGEMRLPGESYERIWNMEEDMEKAMKLEVGGSLLGYDTQTIINHWLHRDDVKSPANQDILDTGTKVHAQMEKEMHDLGVAISSEQYVKNDKVNIGGFYDMEANTRRLIEWAMSEGANVQYYKASSDLSGLEEYQGFYEAPVQLSTEEAMNIIASSPRSIVDIKTRGDKQFENDLMQFPNAQQVNFYASEMQTNVNAILEVNRDNPDEAPKLHLFDYSQPLLNESIAKVETARSMVYQMIDDGAIGRGDLYGPVDRYRILADVAPYSQEFREMKAQLSLMNLSEEEKKQIQVINEQVSERKDYIRTTDYRFQTANVENVNVTVTEVLDNNTFLTKEYPNNPIKLAGVYVPSGQDEAGQEAREFLSDYIFEGKQLLIGINGDEQNVINNDTYNTISAVVRTGGIRNLNYELIERGLAKEKEEDYSAPAIHARFTPGQIAFGSVWEKVAHIDTPFHSKLLHVASPIEEYERREVYGKSWQDWADPVDDYFIPWYQNWISKSPESAIVMGAFIGSFFGNRSPKYGRFGRIMGALIGGTMSALGVTYAQGVEMISGERWIPERRQKEREIEEYFDILEYVKYRSLYENTADLALQEEGFNTRGYLARQQQEGDKRKYELGQLQSVKQALKVGEQGAVKAARKLVGAQENVEAYMKAINARITEIQNTREAQEITPIAAQAIAFYNESEKTMYAYDAGDPLANILSALPKDDRRYFPKLLEAPEEERYRILQTVPDYMKRALQSSWGMPVDAKPDLYEYFTEHGLPDDTWSGWDPRASLDDIKVKLVKHEAMDNSEFDIWPEDEKRAAMIQENQVPRLRTDQSVNIVREKLRNIFGEAGFKNLEIEVQATETPGVNMDLQIYKNRQEEVRQQLNQNGGYLI